MPNPTAGAQPPARLLVVGSVNIDLSAHVPRLPRPGQTVLGGDPTRTPGGKGANQAVAAARLGARVRMVAAVGADAFGDLARTALTSDAVDTTHVAVLPDVPTGLAMIVVEDGGENTVTVAPGANRHLTPVSGASRPHPGETLLLQLEIPPVVSLAAAHAAAESGALVVLNAAPLPTADLPDAVSLLLAHTDVLVVNESEATALRRHQTTPAPTTDAPTTDPAVVASALRALGPDRVVVTLGARGAVWADQHRTGRQPPFRLATVDAVGAGDAFCAALAVGLTEGLDLPDAVRRGAAAGALATTAPGARAALPRRADVDALTSAVPDP